MKYEFRGKDQRGQWHFGSLVTGWMYDENKHPTDTVYIQKYIHHAAVQVLPETVGQTIEYFGKKFSAGDLISIPCYCDSEYGCGHGDGIYEMVWNPETAGFALRFKGVGRFEALDNYDSDDMLVVGNRWDNPELLGEERE